MYVCVRGGAISHISNTRHERRFFFSNKSLLANEFSIGQKPDRLFAAYGYRHACSL